MANETQGTTQPEAPKGPVVKPSGRVSRDSFADKNPYRIEKRLPGNDEFPDGFQLMWLNPALRNSSMGWQGWTLIQYGDSVAGENGELLAGYLGETPVREFGPDRVDNYVRKSDLILGYLPAVWFDARQAASAQESRELVDGLAQPEGEVLMEHVTSIGGGLQPDKNPNFGKKTAEDKALGKLVSRHRR